MAGREYLDQVTVNGITIYAGTSSPDGVLTATRGSLFSNKTDGTLWRNTDGATAWSDVSGVSTGTRTTFTYQQGGVADPTTGTYVTFALAHAAARASADLGEIVTLVIDSSLGAPLVTAGTFDMENIRLVGVTGLGLAAGGSPLTPLGTSQGSIFTNWTLGAAFILLTHNSTLPLYEPSGAAGFNVTRTGEASQFACSLAGPIWHAATAAGPMILIMDPYSTFPTGAAEVAQCTAPNDISVRFSAGATIEGDTLKGTGDFGLVEVPGPESFETVQTNHSGTLTAVYVDPALTSATPGDWAGTPTSHNAAINRIAAALAVSIAGPIP